jgi:hypothetical protein
MAKETGIVIVLQKELKYINAARRHNNVAAPPTILRTGSEGLQD